MLPLPPELAGLTAEQRTRFPQRVGRPVFKLAATALPQVPDILTAPGGGRALLEHLELPTRRRAARPGAGAPMPKPPASPLRGARLERACAQ